MKNSALATKLMVAVMFLALLAYFGMNLAAYFTDPYTTTVAYAYTGENAVTVSGYVVREEEALAGGGELVYSSRKEGERVGRGGTVAVIYPTAQALSDANVLRDLTSQLEQLEYARSLADGSQAAARLDEEIAGALGDFRAAMAEGSGISDIVLRERLFGDIHPVKIVPAGVENSYKIDYLREACLAAKEYHDEISQVNGNYMEVDHKILIATSEGLFAQDRQIRTRVSVSSIASKDGENQTGSMSPGARKGLELFEDLDPKELGRKASAQAVTMLHAGYIKAGTMPVAIENGFGGVIFHEACGHSLEASHVALGQSQFTGKLGTQIANTKVTAIDDGTIPNAWGSVNIDDEGVEGQKTYIVKEGILTSYLHDRISAKHYGIPSTGNGRRESFRQMPIPRMRATYMEAGNVTEEEMISTVKKGIYASSFTNGQVQIGAGDFTFFVKDGYLIEDGKLTQPIKDINIIGNGPKALADITMVGNNYKMDNGTWTCGKDGQSCPVTCGMPSALVSKLTVGGEN